MCKSISRCVLIYLIGCHVVLLVLCRPGQAALVTGSYTGNNTSNRAISQLGFQPDVVLIKSDDRDRAVIRTSTMPGDSTKPMIGLQSSPGTNRITSLDADGFTVGSHSDVNGRNATYYWIAWQAVEGEVAVGSYTGNQVDNRTIDISETSASSDFQPAYVVVMSAGSQQVVQRFSVSPGETTFGFDQSIHSTNHIQALLTNGFQIGTDDRVNQSGETYHYVAWKAASGTMAAGSYSGNGMDNRNITGLGFPPEYVIVRPDALFETVHSMVAINRTMDFSSDSNFTDGIQAFLSDGLQVGTASVVNENGVDYYWVAFGRQVPTAVTMNRLTATAHEDGVLLSWRTGLDMNNLGWHVYREVNGRRVRLTPGRIAGSAFLFGTDVNLTAGRSYQWWDPVGLATDRYWIEDQDLKGQPAWHGPIRPVESDAPRQKKPRSILLGEAGRPRRTRTKTRLTRPQHRKDHGRRRPVHPLSISVQVPRPWEAPHLSPEAVQYALAAAPAIQLRIREPGWYRVSQPELVRAGLDPEMDPGQLQLYAEGQQQPIKVTGGDDGRFDPQDTLEFYGLALDTPWTDTRTYWLVAGSQLGHRIPAESSQPHEAAPPQSYPATVEWQERLLYLATVKNGEAENFFGAIVGEDSVAQVLALSHLDDAPPADAQLEVVLQGVTASLHQVIVQLNGHDVGTMTFSGQVREARIFPIPQTWLLDGDNAVTLIPIDGEALSVVEAIRLTYWRTYTADHDWLHFTATGQHPITITGFSQPDIRVVDITASRLVHERLGHVVPHGAGYAITVTAERDGPRTLLAFTNAQVKSPTAIIANSPSAWHRSEQGADLVIISHRAFVESLAPLQAVRESQGWSVVVIDVDDLYDEFNFSAKSTQALRTFLHHASTTWQTPPRFVLLVGDATFDPRNYLDLDDADFVPTPLVETRFLETASDDWLVDFDEDDVPDLAIGRLPVRTVAEANQVVAKLVSYAQTRSPDTRSREALLVADHGDGFDFAKASTDVARVLRSHLSVDELSLDQTNTAALRSDLWAHLNAGKLLVTYLGHGSIGRWSSEGLLTSADTQALTNGDCLPVVISLTCLNGFFHDLYSDSLAEALLRADQGGAIAVWASSGLTAPQGQVTMNRELVQALFGTPLVTLGEAIIQAKARVRDRDVKRTWLLFGDPTIRLK